MLIGDYGEFLDLETSMTLSCDTGPTPTGTVTRLTLGAQRGPSSSSIPPSSGNTFPLTWKVSKQTFTASSSVESEVVSYSNDLRHEAIPVQSLMEVFLGNRLFIRNLVDNTQAPAACDKGYSKRLRYLARTHRVALGVMHDLLHDPEQCITSSYVQSASQKRGYLHESAPTSSFHRGPGVNRDGARFAV